MHTRLSLREPLAWASLLLAALFFCLAVLFVLAPAPAAAFFGLATNEPSALTFVRAVGLRDLALASYLAGLTLAGDRRSLTILLAATVVIPVGDMLLLALAGAGTPAHFLLHAASLLCFAALAWWARRSRPRS